MRKDLKKVLKALHDQGFESRRTTKGHYQVYKDGEYVGTLAGTPSDHRSWDNSLRKAKRMGFKL